MLRINWQNQELEVSRIVLRRDDRSAYERSIIDLAGRLRVGVGDDTSDPTPGDFWIGCYPRAGWGDADPQSIGWASLVEVPVAVALLHLTATNRTRRLPAVLDEPYETESERPHVALSR